MEERSKPSAIPSGGGTKTTQTQGAKIEHIVVLMLENRSFDHMCGYLKKLNSNIEGLNGNEQCPYDPLNPQKGSVQVDNSSGYVTRVDPDHEVPATAQQIYGYEPPRSTNDPPMDGFVLNYNQRGDTEDKGAAIMRCFDPARVPVISQLATEFAFFDHWYSAVPGPTQPNRFFLHSATSWGCTAPTTDDLIEGYPMKTIFESLSEAGHTWRDYFQDFPSVMLLSRLREPWWWDCFSDLDGFYKDVAAGTLPTYSFVEPRWYDFYDWGASDQHPPHDVQLGEYLMADVYEALRAGPKWENTLLIITYDEHGGFYDHVPPPQSGVPPPDDHRPPSDQPPFNFDRLGVRVPCIMISPWIPKGTLIHEPPSSHYTHTSILGTFKKLFDLPSYLTKRDEWSATFEHLLTLRDTPRSDAPWKLSRPGDATLQEEWHTWNKVNTTSDPAAIHAAIKRGGPISENPLTDLQKEILAGALGCAKMVHDPLEYSLIVAEAQALQTEHDGAIFVRREILHFLSKMKELQEKERQNDKEKEKEEWVVL